MPSRMIHYLVAEEVAKQVEIKNRNRFKIGSLCPDMSSREDESKHLTHFTEILGEKKGLNWLNFTSKYGEEMKRDDLYLGVLCHLITDGVWLHDVMNMQIRSEVKSREERQPLYQKGYADFHRLNYILKNEFSLQHQLEEDRTIELDGLRMDHYDEVLQGLYADFYQDPVADKSELEIYTYDISLECIRLCIKECVKAIKAFRKGGELIPPEKYYVPV
ncbi:MAG: zinc dependent phospholipase C family protein [Lachnospiraceae bacterium]|nr:zinc dependent phospholipase C family protein [Lachnospiraceae bacterium]